MSRREQKLLLCSRRLPWIRGGRERELLILLRLQAILCGIVIQPWLYRSVPRAHGVGWKQAIGMQALATVPVNIFSKDTIVALSLWSQEPGFDRRKHLAWVGEEDVGSQCVAGCGAGRRPHTVRSVPECLRTTFPAFTCSTARVSPSGWAWDGVA